MAIVFPLLKVVEQDLLARPVVITRCRLSLLKVFVGGVESHHHASIQLIFGHQCDYLARDRLQGIKDAADACNDNKEVKSHVRVSLLRAHLNN